MSDRRPTVVVTGVSGDAGQGIVKGLRAAPSNPRVVGLDYTPDNVGFVICDVGVRVPGFVDEGYVSTLRDICVEHRACVLMLGIDGEQPLLAEYRALIEEVGCRVAVSARDVVEQTADKLLTSKWLASFGLPALKTLPTTLVASQILDRIQYPLIAKPRAGHGSQGVRLVRTDGELHAALEALGEGGCIQPYVEGPEYTCALLFDDRSSLVDWLVMRRDLVGGRTVRAEVVDEPAVSAFIEHLGAQVRGALGAINLQLRIDRDGAVWVFEVNPRFSGSTAMRVAAGYNEPARLFEHLAYGTSIAKVNVPKVKVYRAWSEIVVPSEAGA